MRDQLSIAYSTFRVGDFARAAAALVRAGEIQMDARNSLGLDELNTRIIGSEITDAFGHLAVGPEIRIKARTLGLAHQQYVVVKTPSAANSALATYWASVFPTLELSEREGAALERRLWPIVESIQWFHDGIHCRHLYKAYAHIESQWEAAGLGPALSLTDEHSQRGRELLTSLGVPDDAWFAALHVRASTEGSAYGRNALATSYAPAVQRVREAGGHVIQIGHGACGSELVPGVISIADARRNQPWLDLFILGAARFLIGTQSGPSSVASAFGTPVLLTNATGWGFLPFLGRTRSIPKLVRRRGSAERPLVLAEMIHQGLVYSDAYLPTGADGVEFEWVDNSADDIEAGIEEMLSEPRNGPKDDQDVLLDNLHTTLVGYPGVRLTTASKQHLL